MNLEIKEIKKDGLLRTYQINISAEELNKTKTAKLDEVSKEASIQGFRPGKAPKTIIEAKFKDKIMPDVLDTVVKDAVDQLYVSNKIESISRPDVSIESFTEDTGVQLSVTLEVFPEIPEIDFSKIKLDRDVVEVSDKEIQESLEQIASHNKEVVDIKKARAAKSGDVAVINFKGLLDGTAFAGGTGDNYPLELGSNSFIPGFEDQLIGKNPGDKVDVNVTFPEDYHSKDLAGKPVVFEVEIVKLQESKKPQIDDQLAKKVNMESLEALKEDIKSKYVSQISQLEKGKLKKSLIKALNEVVDFELPERLLKSETDALWSEFEHFKKHLSEPDDHSSHHHNEEEVELTKKPDEEVKAIHLERAKERVKTGLLLNHISKKNSVVVENDDIQEILKSEAMMYGGNVEMLLQYYTQNKEALQGLQARAMEDKIMSFILDKVSYNDNKVSFDDYTKIFK